MRNLIFITVLTFLVSDVCPMQCIDNGLSDEQILMVETGKNIIDLAWNEIKELKDEKEINDKVFAYKRGQSYLDRKNFDPVVADLLYTYINMLRLDLQGNHPLF